MYQNKIIKENLPGEIWAITTYFNPSGYKTKYSNYKIFREHSKLQGLKLITVELSFKKNHFDLSGDDAEILIQITGKENNILWQKERLFNLALKKLPNNCDKIIFIDNDIVFKGFNWIKKTKEALNKHVLVQPFQNRFLLDSNFRTDFSSKKESAASFLSKSNEIDFNLFKNKTPGYCVALRREAINKKLYDKAILGGGDALLIGSYLNFPKKIKREIIKHATNDNITNHYLKNDLIKNKYKNSMGCVNGEILHLWHGDRNNRKYTERYNIFAKNINTNDFAVDNKNLYCWKNKGAIMAIKKYFYGRNEDISLKNKTINLIKQLKKPEELNKKLVYKNKENLITKDALKKELKMAPSISILIPIKNRSDYKLVNLLESLRCQDYPKEKIVIKILDYGSEDPHKKTIKQLSSVYGIDYTYVNNGGLFSRAKALNILIKNTTTKYILSADSDIIFKKNYVSELISNFENNPYQIIFCEPKDLPKGILKNKLTVANFDYLEKISFYRGGLKLSNTGYRYGKGLNAGLTYFYKSIGGYDEFYEGWGSEDDDLIKRFSSLGLNANSSIDSINLHQWHKKFQGYGIKNKELNKKINLNRDYCKNTNTILRNNTSLF